MHIGDGEHSFVGSRIHERSGGFGDVAKWFTKLRANEFFSGRCCGVNEGSPRNSRNVRGEGLHSEHDDSGFLIAFDIIIIIFSGAENFDKDFGVFSVIFTTSMIEEVLSTKVGDGGWWCEDLRFKIGNKSSITRSIVGRWNGGANELSTI